MAAIIQGFALDLPLIQCELNPESNMPFRPLSRWASRRCADHEYTTCRRFLVGWLNFPTTRRRLLVDLCTNLVNWGIQRPYTRGWLLTLDAAGYERLIGHLPLPVQMENQRMEEERARVRAEAHAAARQRLRHVVSSSLQPLLRDCLASWRSMAEPRIEARRLARDRAAMEDEDAAGWERRQRRRALEQNLAWLRAERESATRRTPASW